MSESRPPRFVLLGGPNGSGKSTVADVVVRRTWEIERFLNADTIARGLSGFNPDLAMVAAGRVVLTEAQRHIAARTDFALETTLSGNTYARWLKNDLADWRTHLTFVYTQSADENLMRVQRRFLAGGHNVPEADVRRRYERSFANFFKLYRPLVVSWDVRDNTDPRERGEARIVARQVRGQPVEVLDVVEWERLEQTYG